MKAQLLLVPYQSRVKNWCNINIIKLYSWVRNLQFFMQIDGIALSNEICIVFCIILRKGLVEDANLNWIASTTTSKLTAEHICLRYRT